MHSTSQSIGISPQKMLVSSFVAFILN